MAAISTPPILTSAQAAALAAKVEALQQGACTSRALQPPATRGFRRHQYPARQRGPVAAMRRD